MTAPRFGRVGVYRIRVNGRKYLAHLVREGPVYASWLPVGLHGRRRLASVEGSRSEEMILTLAGHPRTEMVEDKSCGGLVPVAWVDLEEEMA